MDLRVNIRILGNPKQRLVDLRKYAICFKFWSGTFFYHIKIISSKHFLNRSWGGIRMANQNQFKMISAQADQIIERLVELVYLFVWRYMGYSQSLQTFIGFISYRKFSLSKTLLRPSSKQTWFLLWLFPGLAPRGDQEPKWLDSALKWTKHSAWPLPFSRWSIVACKSKMVKNITKSCS